RLGHSARCEARPAPRGLATSDDSGLTGELGQSGTPADARGVRMRQAYLDPSAWVKRYYHEVGTALTNTLFAELLTPRPSRLFWSGVGLTEVVSVLNRHRNAGRVTQSLFNMAYAQFEADSRTIRLLSVRNHQLDASIRLLLTHNLNATDALHLQVALEVQSR